MQFSVGISDFYYGTKISEMIAKGKSDEQVRHFFQYTGEDSGYFYNVLPGGESMHCLSKYQDIKIIDTIDFGRCLLLDEKMMLCSVEEHEYHELIIHPSCLQIVDFQHALILGGGDCFTARDLLKYPIKSVDMIELDEVVVQVCRKEFAKELGNIFEDSRFNIHYQDAFNFSSEKKYDYVALDLTDPDETTNLSLPMYTQESFEKIKGYMSDNSILAVQAGCPISMPIMFQETLAILRKMFKYVAAYGKYISMYGGYQYFIYCSDKYDVQNPNFDTINKHMNEYGFSNLKIYSPDYHDLLLKEFLIFTSQKSIRYAEVETQQKNLRQADLISRMSDNEILKVIDEKALPQLLKTIKTEPQE